MERFDTLLRRLAELDLIEADLERRDASLEERSRVHDELIESRAQMARLRDELGLDRLPVSGNDGRTRRFRPGP